ncbi:hypothetical protein D5086_010572 [Populus alba]|uniref:Uncharacterized protein n=1 Tax=Populus alba TaxID=43335 RepID=A0ACC4C9S1_POPAL
MGYLSGVGRSRRKKKKYTATVICSSLLDKREEFEDIWAVVISKVRGIGGSSSRKAKGKVTQEAGLQVNAKLRKYMAVDKWWRKRGSNTWQSIWLVTSEMCPFEYRRSQVGVPSSEVPLQLAIFDLILPLDECFRFQIMTERQANGLSAEPGCASSLPQAFMATFPDGRWLLEKTNLCLRNSDKFEPLCQKK